MDMALPREFTKVFLFLFLFFFTGKIKIYTYKQAFRSEILLHQFSKKNQP